MICKNCGTELKGRYCHQCGQRAGTKRISGHYISEAVSNAFGLERGLLHTIIELFRAPGNALNDYLAGKRISYTKPLGYLILMTATYAIVSYFIGSNPIISEGIMGLMEAISETHDNASERSEVVVKLGTWLTKNIVYISAISLIMFSVATSITFRKSRFNFFEHLIINIYTTAQQMLIYSLIAIFAYALDLSSSTTQITALGLAIGYMLWTFIPLFNTFSTWSILLRTFAAYLLYTLFISLTIASVLFTIKAVYA